MTTINEFYVIECYSKHNKSTYEIAKELNTYPNKINRILKKNGVLLRDKGEAQSIAIKEGKRTHPTKGTKRPQSVKDKISDKMAGIWKHMSEEERERRASLAKAQWENMSDEDRAEFKKSAGKALRKAAEEGSKLEQFLLVELRRKGHKVDFHVSNIVTREKLEVDLLLPQINVAIEIDGPAHFYPIWGEKNLSKHLLSDNYKTGLLIQEGYTVIRVKHLIKTISEIHKRKVFQKIVEVLDKIEDNKNKLIEIEVS